MTMRVFKHNVVGFCTRLEDPSANSRLPKWERRDAKHFYTSRHGSLATGQNDTIFSGGDAAATFKTEMRSGWCDVFRLAVLKRSKVATASRRGRAEQNSYDCPNLCRKVWRPAAETRDERNTGGKV